VAGGEIINLNCKGKFSYYSNSKHGHGGKGTYTRESRHPTAQGGRRFIRRKISPEKDVKKNQKQGVAKGGKDTHRQCQKGTKRPWTKKVPVPLWREKKGLFGKGRKCSTQARFYRREKKNR